MDNSSEEESDASDIDFKHLYNNKNEMIVYNTKGLSPNNITRRNKIIINDEFSNNSDEKYSNNDNSIDTLISDDISSENTSCNNLDKNNDIFNNKKSIFISKKELNDWEEQNNSSDKNPNNSSDKNPNNANNKKRIDNYYNKFPSPYFSKYNISLMSEIDVIKIFDSFDLIIYTDDYKLRNKTCKDMFAFFTKKRYICEENLPGIAFISIDSIQYIKSLINIHNKDLQDSENEPNENSIPFQICFDEGDHFKNMLYKKLQIHDKLLFVPYNKFQLKLTEYKLRSFCQIMEELGAVEIEIDFNHINLNKKSKNLKIQAEEFNYIAGSLGFSSNKNSSTNEEITYKLSYPHNNTLILNEKNIRSRIAKGKFIINKKSFDSNLELQFIITSRCRHFIENYSTVFTLDNSSNYDNKLISNLKSNSFSCGMEYESKTLKKLKITINTKVKFCSQIEIGNNLLGNNVSFDDTGFNYLMSSIKKDKFGTIGIFKIIAFIEKYIDKIIKKEEKSYFINIKRLYKIIYKEFSTNEFKDLLLDHFNPDSQWINFLNFINVLKFKTVSYNKLGFLILMSQDKITVYEKNLKVIDFIRHLCETNNSEDKFWDMLEPTNYFSIIHKLDKDYNILRKYNWFNIQKLLRDISKFTPDLKEEFDTSKINSDEFYGKLNINFKLGHNYSQFQKIIKPFLYIFINLNFKDRINNLNEISNNEIFFINSIYQSIKPKHFISYDINTIGKLKTLINHKFNQIEESCKFYKELYDNIYSKLNTSKFSIFSAISYETNYNIKDILYNILKSLFEKDTFRKEYSYIYKKCTSILDNCENIPNYNQYDELNENYESNHCKFSNEIKELINISIDSTSDINKICLNIVKKLVIHDIDISNHDFTRENLTESYFNYINEYVRNFNQSKLCFIKVRYFVSLCNFIINQNYSTNFKKHSFFSSEILILHQTSDTFSLEDIEKYNSYNLSEETINLIKDIIICYNYKHILAKVIFFLKNDIKLEIKRDIINLLN